MGWNRLAFGPSKTKNVLINAVHRSDHLESLDACSRGLLLKFALVWLEQMLRVEFWPSLWLSADRPRILDSARGVGNSARECFVAYFLLGRAPQNLGSFRMLDSKETQGPTAEYDSMNDEYQRFSVNHAKIQLRRRFD